MQSDRDLLKQALEALEYPGPSWPDARQSIAAALRERLAQPEQEPVGLTDEEIKAMPQWFPSHETAAVMPLIRAIEAKIKDKNA